MKLVAHGLRAVQDLPIPLWLALWAAAVVLVVSFVMLGALWNNPLLGVHERGRAVGERLSRFVTGPLRVVVQALSVLLFGLVWASALFGDTDPYQNLAPTWIYVIFWLGVPALSVLLGNVWRAISPWRALADAFVWVRERGGVTVHPLAVYPERLGRWPGAVVIFAFATLELAYTDPSSPRALAFAIALYTYVALFGMAAFGRDTWERTGEGFAVLFGLLARIAPLHVLDGALRLRWPFTGLAGADPSPGTVAFVSVMLGAVLFDGFSGTPTWQDLMVDLEGPYLRDQPGLGELLVAFAAVGGILTAILLIAFAYLAACALARSSVNAPRSLVPDFLRSVLPIAFVYLVAHYATTFLDQGQFLIPLLSDPLGRGWDLLGPVDYVPTVPVLTQPQTWWLQVTVLVAGHVAGLAVAHDRAVTIFADKRNALVSQLAFLALMVLYTLGGLWVLSRG